MRIRPKADESSLDRVVNELGGIQVGAQAKFHGGGDAHPSSGGARIPGEAARGGKEEEALLVAEDLFHLGRCQKSVPEFPGRVSSSRGSMSGIDKEFTQLKPEMDGQFEGSARIRWGGVAGLVRSSGGEGNLLVSAK